MFDKYDQKHSSMMEKLFNQLLLSDLVNPVIYILTKQNCSEQE